MTDHSSSLARPSSLTGQWRDYLAFIKRPHLPSEVTGFGRAGVVAALRLLALDVLIMIALIGVAATALGLGYEFPDNALEDLEWTPAIIFLIVIIVPLYEEIAFRGWLSSKLWHVLGVAALVGLALLAASMEEGVTLAPSWLIGGLVFLGLVAVLGKTGLFGRFFPFFFWLSSAGFALIHLANYEAGPLAGLLPLVIPQLIAGTLFGYIRVHHGLWASFLLHALHNGAALTAAVLSETIGLPS